MPVSIHPLQIAAPFDKSDWIFSDDDVDTEFSAAATELGHRDSPVAKSCPVGALCQCGS